MRGARYWPGRCAVYWCREALGDKSEAAPLSVDMRGRVRVCIVLSRRPPYA